MNGYLLDVNALIALAWPSHVLHQSVGRWFDRHAERGWATCPFTQTAFVRILSNPAFSPRWLAPENALNLLERNLTHRAHHFWPADISLPEALAVSNVRATGHQQISDIYLLGLATHKKGMLATCNGAIALWDPHGKSTTRVELIQ